MRLEHEELLSLEELRAVEPDWWQLWEADPAATPFQSPAWLIPWTRQLWGGGRIRTVVFRDAGRIAGLAPLFFWGYGSEKEPVCVSFLGSGISDCLGPVVLPGAAQACAQELIVWLMEHSDEWQICDLQELLPDAPLLQAIRSRGIVAQSSVCSVCPAARLAPDLEQYLAGLDSKFRTNLRRAERLLERAGPAQFVLANDSNWREILEELFRLHASRWREREEEGVLAGASLRTFHREAAERMQAHGILRLYGLYCNARCIAVQYNIASKGTVYAYLSGFDPEFAKFSPGAVLLKHSIAGAIREGIEWCDFLRNREGFKYDWGAVDRAHQRIRIQPAGVPPA
jgi:CelD/BcsL family acetyltransferase involved in cellulose biosynthesis